MTTEGAIPVTGTDFKLDTTRVTQTDGTIADREAVIIADPDDNDARISLEIVDDVYRLPVSNLAALAELVAGNLHIQTAQEELLQKIVGELKVMNYHLALISDDATVVPDDLYGDER